VLTLSSPPHAIIVIQGTVNHEATNERLPNIVPSPSFSRSFYRLRASRRSLAEVCHEPDRGEAMLEARPAIR
jgi:hypothetical protein